MTIHAYTEPSGPYPAFVNLSERDPNVFVLTVRSQGDDGRNVGSIDLTREQLLALINDACEHLDGDFDEHATATDRDHEAEARHARVLEMALRTPQIAGQQDVVDAASAYLKFIKHGGPGITVA